jgi:hypothetical protein
MKKTGYEGLLWRNVQRPSLKLERIAKDILKTKGTGRAIWVHTNGADSHGVRSKLYKLAPGMVTRELSNAEFMAWVP